jgi:F-type H+-transporting ATPase subunit delta
MKHYKASLRYGRSLFEVARENDSLEQTTSDLNLIDRVLSEAPELLPFLESLVGKEGKRKELMEKAFKPFVSDQTWRFLELLLKRKRMGVLEWIPTVFQRYYDEHFGIVETRIEGVYPLSNEEKNSIKKRLEEKIKKKIRLDFVLNQKLLAGFRLFLGDKLIDCSVANQLQQIRKTMLTT